jgi:hypothetical protein
VNYQENSVFLYNVPSLIKASDWYITKSIIRFDVTSVDAINDGRRYHCRHVLLPHTCNVTTPSMWAWWMGRNRLLRRIIGCNFYNLVPAE